MNQNSESNSDKQQPNVTATSTSWWRKLTLTLVVLVLGGAGGGLIYGWYFVQRKLVPLIETETSNYLHRPLQLGDLQSLSPTGATFGDSSLKATANNPDFVEVKKVKVKLAPLYFLRTRRLKLDLALIEPDVYIEQDSSKLWTPTDFGSDHDTEGGIEVEVKSIVLEDGKLTLAAYNSDKAALNPAVKAKLDRLVVNSREGEIKFAADAALLQGGNFTVDGQGNTNTGIIDLDILANDLNAKQVSNLLALPIELQQGKLNGNLGVTLTDAPIPLLQGKIALDEVSLQIPNLVKPFSQSNGEIDFAGSQVRLNNVKTKFGQVAGTAAGSLDFAETGNYQLQTKIAPTPASQVIEALELDSPVPIEGNIAGDVKVSGALEDPVIAFDIATVGQSKIDRLDFKYINANLEIIGSTLAVRQFTSLPKSGGKIEGNGKLELDGKQNLAFNVFADSVSGEAIARSYNNTLPVDLGLITGNTKLSAQAGDINTLRLQDGQGSFALGNGKVKVRDLTYSNGKWSAAVNTAAVEFGSLPFGEGSATTIAKGLIDGQFAVAGTQDIGNLDQLKVTGKANLNTVGGKVALPVVKVADGGWQADAKLNNLQLQRLFPDLPNEFNDDLSGEFYLTGNIPDEAEPQTLINGKGNLNLAQGRVKVKDLKIVNQNWTAVAEGTDLKLKELSSTTPDQFAGLVNGELKLTGTTDNITPEGIKAQGKGSLTLPEGVFEAKQIAIADGGFQATVNPLGVNLSLFADPNSDDLELNGQLRGELELTGQVDNLSPTAVAANGELTFSEGIDLLEQPLGAKVAWDGKRLDVLQAKGDGLDATGYVVLDPSFFGDLEDKLAAVDHFEFAVEQANSLDVRKLRLTLPSWATNLNYSGIGDFAGQISGIPSAMTINGDVAVRNLRVENIEFDSFLAGKVAISPATGVDVNLEEVPVNQLPPEKATTPALDRVELLLDENFSPLAFAVVQDNIAVKGTGKQEILEFTTQNIPVGLLKTVAIKSEDLVIPDNLALQPVGGALSGKFVFNLNTLATAGEDIEIINPRLDSIRGDRLVGDFQYADDYFAIQDAEFKQRNSIYKLEGNLIQKPDDIELEGRVAIDDGQIQDILVALQIFEIADLGRIFSDRFYGDAAALYPLPPAQPPLASVGLKDASVLEQIRLLSEVQAWLAKAKEQRQNALIPPIKDLKGKFDGKLNVSGSLNRGLDSEFEFSGKKWQWGNLISKKVIAKGNLSKSILTLLPISIQLQDTTANKAVDNPDDQQNKPTPTLLFTGTFGGESQSGQFRLVEMPMKLIEQIFSLPPELGIDGLLNATASIAGTTDDPRARGELRIDNASLNDTSIQSTRGSFNYQDARVKFSASSVVAEDADPLVVRGSIPYKLPASKVELDSDRLELQVNVKDKGLTLLDIVSGGELKWIGGEGEIVLDISGILDAQTNLPRQLVAQGEANISKATIAAKSLPKNQITNIDSQIFFDLDNIRVSSFEGDFGGGKILAAGTVPLSNNVAFNPLTIDFENIKIELPKLYEGGFAGRLQILGKATEPNITGQVTLSEGTILLASEETESESEVVAPKDPLTGVTRRDVAEEGIAAVTQYKDLKLKLGEDVEISQPPIFTFLATGDLNINGTFLQPSPQGTIFLQRGQVNLFTTQLNLSRDYKNIARFSSNNVLDPFLDVLLVGSALETTQRTVPSEVLPTEIPDVFNVGTLETVRISAKVKGLASQITNKIELTSSPPRSQAEIAALLGGGFVEALGNSSGTLGLATLAGSALFGSLNSEFNDFFPIGELRLFPTQIIDEDRDVQQNEGLAGEIAFDLIDDFSFSILKILNTDIPARYGFRYRLNNNFVLRGSSNFQEDGSRALIEFESRF